MEIAYSNMLFIRRKLNRFLRPTTFFCISWMDLQIINSYLESPFLPPLSSRLSMLLAEKKMR